MHARIKNPALSVPGALDALRQLGDSATTAGIPETTLYMVDLRASQINGCAVCVDIHSRELEYAGETSERIHTIAAWRETPYSPPPSSPTLSPPPFFNRLNATTRQITGGFVDQIARAAAPQPA